ncbi:transcriptional regulator ATRX-like isoform X2 [Sminthopsis crassicaudata]|uniref:transcriptional regulator ATRX-like isoform X2 n=1 Tax=Sminthopsis crassicaudata TaxID=9301 RepID=UPI003D68EB58
MESPEDEGSGRSEEPKPSCPERKEHMDCDDGQMVHESINPFHSDENSHIPKSFAEDNVIVQLEPKKKEDRDDFQELEVRHKSRIRIKTAKRHIGERLRDIVCCTACGQQVTHYEDSVYRHPALNVLICESCYMHLSEDISHDSTRPDKHCRWCAEGGDLIFCGFCHNAFCTKCIRCNLGEKELSKVMDENTEWRCYICQPEPLLDLVAMCDCVFDNLSHLDPQSEKKKLVSEKSDNTCAQSEKLNPGSCAEETPQVCLPSSDTAPCPFPTLLIPENLIEKTKALVEYVRETSTNLLQQLQQTSPYSEVSPSERHSQCEIVKSMITEVHNAQEAWEDLSKLVVKDIEENKKERENENV